MSYISWFAFGCILLVALVFVFGSIFLLIKCELNERAENAQG